MEGLFQDHVTLTLPATRIGDFYPMLQQGVRMPCRTGCTLGELLSGQWGIAAGYVRDRITTVFLNHRAIDDVTTAHVRGGATIALSGAMPGLVGATMRRGGYYAAMRGAMTHRENTEEDRNQPAWVRLKLFNLLLPELGPDFLRRGILMDGPELMAFLVERDAGFWPESGGIRVNGSTVSREAWLDSGLPPGQPDILLTVLFED